ncbi:MAG: GAF domain-containing protein [Verrucomicrobiae bacterium]|nr:GAF domain-containing protein [Verrucomicrobiae bacterium]
MRSDLLQPDVTLEEHAVLIEQRLEACSRRMQPEDLRALLGNAGRELVAVTVKCLEADSASIWLMSGDRTRLIVSHVHPANDSLMNRDQPLDKGLVSLVLRSEQPICENRVYEHRDHSKLTDESLGLTTCSMIAVPCYAGGVLRGVVSCVRVKSEPSAPDPREFDSADLARMSRLSNALEQILNFRLLSGLLGLDL